MLTSLPGLPLMQQKINYHYKAGTNNWEKNDLDKDYPNVKKFSDPDAPFNVTGSRRDIFLARPCRDISDSCRSIHKVK